jgi:hypothetical protein
MTVLGHFRFISRLLSYEKYLGRDPRWIGRPVRTTRLGTAQRPCRRRRATGRLPGPRPRGTGGSEGTSSSLSTQLRPSIAGGCRGIRVDGSMPLPRDAAGSLAGRIRLRFVRRRGSIRCHRLIERGSAPTRQTFGGGPAVGPGQQPECGTATVPANKSHACVLPCRRGPPHSAAISHRGELVDTHDVSCGIDAAARSRRNARSGSLPSNRLMSNVSTDRASKSLQIARRHAPAGQGTKTVLQTVDDVHIFSPSNSYGPLALPPFQAGPSDLP